MEQKKNYTVPIIMMFALFAMISFVTGLASPMALIAKDQFGASNAMSQLGNFANFIAYAFMGIPGGILLKRKGYKVTALIAVAIGFVGVGIQFLSGVAASFSVYLIGAFVAGFSMCLLNLVVNPMLNTLGGGGKKGNQLVQFGGSLNSLAATITPVLVGYLIGGALRPTIKDASPAMFIALAIFAVVFVVLLMVRIPEPHMEAAGAKKVKEKHSPLSFRHFIVGAVSTFFSVGVEVGIPMFIMLYLRSLGVDTAIAGSVAGTYWFLMLIGRFTGGLIGEKVSSKAMVTFAACLGMALVLIAIFSSAGAVVKMPVFKSDISFGLAEVPIGVMLLALCGLCTSVMWGGIYNMSAEGLGKYVPMGAGIFMVMVCGGGILPVLQGAVADWTASYMASYWVIFAGFLFIAYYALIGSKNVNKDIPVD